MSPEISVIIPVFNSEKDLEECVNSILCQSFSDFEIILIDDGSSDRSFEICQTFCKNDNRVHFVSQKNKGVSSARNNGIANAQGRYISFIDADDYVDSEFLKRAYRIMKDNCYDLYASGLVMEFWENGCICKAVSYTSSCSGQHSVKEILEQWGKGFPQIYMSGPCCKLYKSSIIKDNKIFFDESLDRGEDLSFNLDYLSKSNITFFDTNIYYHYRRENKNSLYSRYNSDAYNVYKKVYGKMRNLRLIKSCENRNEFNELCVGQLIGMIHDSYKHKMATTPSMRKHVIKLISEDELIKEINVMSIQSVKNRVIVFFLKKKLWRCVYAIFSVYYLKRSSSKIYE